MNEYQQKIESLLFYKNQPLSFSWLSRVLGVSLNNVSEEVQGMMDHYQHRGIELVVVDNTVSLVTHRNNSELINELADSQEAKELSKQALETLAIVVMKQQVTKAEIDFIRGVNSVYILRNLSVRGLIEKKTNPQDRRSPLYVPSIDLLSYLGIGSIEEIPGYQNFKEQLNTINQQFEEEQKNNNEVE
jgi:segregation and condensation protein B